MSDEHPLILRRLTQPIRPDPDDFDAEASNHGTDVLVRQYSEGEPGQWETKSTFISPDDARVLAAKLIRAANLAEGRRAILAAAARREELEDEIPF